MKDKYKPGEICPVSGQWQIADTGAERTVVEGEPFPPTPDNDQGYVLADATAHEEPAPEQSADTDVGVVD